MRVSPAISSPISFCCVPTPERMSLSLAQFDAIWGDRLQSGTCPPVLGLVPLSDEDCASVTAQIEARFPNVPNRLRSHTFLLKLLREHSAITSIWLARKASAAYDGSFWKRFESEIGVSIPVNERRHFANEFRRAGSRSMTNFTVPDENSAWKYAGEFLFQAGLPLHHCTTFADLMHRSERRFGLPDPDMAESAEDLRNNLLVCLGAVPQTNLRRALRGPAGPAICLSALRAVLAGDFSNINPQLGHELARAFQQGDGRGPTQIKRAARPPFLRLSSDLYALEIIGPSQDAALLSSSGVSWVVNGVPERVPSYEDFICNVRTMEPLEVELRGLRAGTPSIPRRFVLRLEQTEEPFLLFDAETRRQLTLGVGSGLVRSLCSGNYYLLHKTEARLEPSTERLDWPDGERSLSFLTIRPGVPVKLDGTGFCFQADRHSFVETNGLCVTTDDGQRIHYAWQRMPDVWVPAESLLVDGQDRAWSLRMRVGKAEQVFPLVPCTSERAVVEGMARCRVTPESTGSEDFLAALGPGLWQLELAVLFGARQQEVRTFEYWQGLKAVSFGDCFEVGAFPGNLVREHCQGYDFKAGRIRRLHDGGRLGRLAFLAHDGGEVNFQWSRTGIFLESFERGAGVAIHPQPHSLGERFSASISSRRELRVWPLPGQDVEIRVGDAVYLRRPAEAVARHLDLSLANLVTLYPQGGDITLGGGPLLATFTRPLALRAATVSGTRHAPELLLTLQFCEAPAFLRFRLRNLVGGGEEEGTLSARQPGVDTEPGAGHAAGFEGVPAVTWTVADAGRTVGVSAPNEGWPPGLWRLECEVSREENGEWQLTMDDAGRPAPVFFVGDVEAEALAAWSPRSRILWEMCAAARLRHPLPELNTLAAEPDALLGLLLEVSAWVRAGSIPTLRSESEWLEHLQDDLQIRAGTVLRTQDEEWTAKLLHLASYDYEEASCGGERRSGSRLFVRLPELLALPASAYRQAPPGNALTRSLRWCADLGRRERVIDGVAEEAHLLDFQTFGDFVNCQRFFPGATPEPGPDEDLTGLKTDLFWQRVERAWSRQGPAANGSLAEWSWTEPLGSAHFLWAMNCLVTRYEAPTAPRLGQVNRLLNEAPTFLGWLQGRFAVGPVVSSSLWPDLNDPRNFIENCPKFASVFALAARTAGAGRLPFADALGWLEAQGSGNQVISTLVGLAPELFGFYLMFWELAVRTNRP